MHGLWGITTFRKDNYVDFNFDLCCDHPCEFDVRSEIYDRSNGKKDKNWKT